MDTWERVKELFETAVDLTPSRRAAFLADTCAGDDKLRREVESLLMFDTGAENFIESPAYEAVAELLAEEGEEELAGRRFGAYNLIREIGRGGMGAVYLAARADDEYQKQVAIKIVKRGMDTDSVLRRFRNERQILARLEHPHIARLLDGGTTETGRPYFVMEYAEGLPITTYCDRQQLSLDARLELFRTACSAVTYAHQNLVIHRDLKPSNILVTEEGVPKLLDFGIAKLLDTNSSARRTETMLALRALTPEYASPEQVSGERVTTASDIYSLGVLLYELLTGHLPYQLKTHRPDEIVRVVCEQEPERPSTAVSRQWSVVNGNHAEQGAESSDRTTNQKSKIRNRKSLRGDLDWIVLMALRKEPARRYVSVEQFSEDIRRYLAGLPVVAHQDTFNYRAGKFVRRHKAGVAAAALVLLLLIGGIVATAWQAKRATEQARIAAEQRDRARIEAVKAERINTFMQRMLSYADPSWYSPGSGRGGEVRVIDALNEAAGRIDTELAEQPEVRAELHHTIGNTYRALGRSDVALAHFRSALELSRQIYGDTHPTVARDLYYLAAGFAQNGDFASAESAHRQAIAMMRTTEPENVNLPYMLQDLGGLLVNKGDTTAAEPLLRKSLELFRRRYGDDHLIVGVGFERLGQMYEMQGDLEQAEAMFREAIERQHRSSGQRPASTLRLLGEIKTMKGEYVEAEANLRESLALARQFFGANHPDVADHLSALAEVHYRRGEHLQAEETLRGALEIQRRTRPKENSNIFHSLSELSRALLRTGRPERAEPYLREALASYQSAAKKGNPNPDTAGVLGECLTLLKRYAEAEPLLTESYHQFKARSGDRHPKTQDALRSLVTLYEAWRKPDQAAFGGGDYHPSGDPNLTEKLMIISSLLVRGVAIPAKVPLDRFRS